MNAAIKTVKYEYTASALGSTVITQKVWIEANKIRIETAEQGREVVILADTETQTGYTYLPLQNLAVKRDYSQVPSPVSQDVETVQKYNPVIIGNEHIDGKECTVISYAKDSAKVKAWLWNDNGFPLKFEVETPQGVALIEIKNVDFGDIPDSLFELPSGVLRSDWMDTPSPTFRSGFSMQDESAVYAAVVRRLATQDDTFGGQLKPPKLFIVRNTDDRVGNPTNQSAESPSKLISQTLQNDITRILQDLPSTIIWIDKLADAEFEGQGISSVKDGGAVITLGNIKLQDDGSVRLAGSIYVANLAAGGTTYILQKKDGLWQITGTTGVMWIS